MSGKTPPKTPSEKRLFRRKELEKKRVQLLKLTWHQDNDLWKNFAFVPGPAFKTPAARRAAWEAHKEEYMVQFKDQGVRPGAWWQYESGIEDLPKFFYRGKPGTGGPDEYVDELEFLVEKGFASEAEIGDLESGRGAMNYMEP